jgi:hypothetical protein
MPYKNRQKQQQYIREYMRRYRKVKPFVYVPKWKVERLKKEFPDVYNQIFEKRKAAKKRGNK